MQSMGRRMIVTTALTGVLTGAGSLRAAEESRELAGRIARVEAGLLPPILVRGQVPRRLNDQMTELHVPGVSVAVIRDGRIEWTKGYGLAEAGTNRQVTPETRFQAASISKPVAALGALALAETGKISLDEDVNRQLKSWKVPEGDPATASKVTVSRLLSHTAGVTVHGFPGYPHGTPLPPLTAILDGKKPANTGPVRVTRAPGTMWTYSGGGYCVLQQLLLDVTNQPFPELMRRTVLGPLEMKQSTYVQPIPPAEKRQAATGHRADGSVIPGRWHDYPEMAAAGLRTTPTDLARFMLEIQRAASGKRGRVLEPDSARRMLTRINGPTGLGLFLVGEGSSRRFFHGGSNEGFRCEMVGYVEQGLGAVVMTNADDGDTLAAAILNSIAREYGWPGYLPQERLALNVDSAELAAYSGKFQISPGRQFTVQLRGGRLFLQIENNRELQLYPEAKDRFFIAEAPVEVTFLRDASGEIVELSLTGAAQIRGRRVKMQ